MRKARGSEAPAITGDPGFDIVSLFVEREGERYALHARYMNEMMVRMLQTIGYDVGFRGGHGQYLFDRAGVRYLDLLSGWGVFGVGRNHPIVREALTGILDHDLPSKIAARLVGGEAAQKVGRAAGRIRHDERHRAVRIAALRVGRP